MGHGSIRVHSCNSCQVVRPSRCRGDQLPDTNCTNCTDVAVRVPLARDGARSSNGARFDSCSFVKFVSGSSPLSMP